MRAKNCLQALHAKLIENEFQAKMALLEKEGRRVPPQEPQASAEGEGATRRRRRQTKNKLAGVNNKVDMVPPFKFKIAGAHPDVHRTNSSGLTRSSKVTR